MPQIFLIVSLFTLDTFVLNPDWLNQNNIGVIQPIRNQNTSQSNFAAVCPSAGLQEVISYHKKFTSDFPRSNFIS